ncbi:MAG: DUF2157 domain-containing protein [Anaerolineales bacterium]|nr:MAG: DUF2157 domain-containing protein [Anaerolineales bacterium]
MDNNKNPLNSPASAENLRRLAINGILDAAALKRGLKIINYTPNREKWERFLNVLLLILGAGFTVSGIFFFFAFNWASMHRFFKLGLLEVAMLVAVGLAFWRGLEKLSGKIALATASLIVGSLLAVYGQIYQTGADSFQLFLGWALLITCWVFIGRFTPLWFTWIVLFNLSLVFYWTQIVGDIDSKLYVWLFLLNGGAILFWEISHSRGVDWLKSRWPARLLSLPAFGALVVPTIILILDFTWQRNRDPWLFLILILFIVSSALVLYVYSQKTLDLFMLTVCSFSIIVTLNTWIVNSLQDLDELLLLILSGLLIGQVALVVTWFRRVSKAWEARRI